MIRIAHLSDLHFGANFDCALWNGVVHEVAQAEPDLIIVSGDLVDHPAPKHLLAAKCALRDLADTARNASAKRRGSAGAAAELIVIPGNHDVYETGVSLLQSRLDWFDRIFENNTGAAEQALADEIGCPPGFTDKMLERHAVVPGLVARAKEFCRIKPNDCTAHIPAMSGQTARQRSFQVARVLVPNGAPVLLALLDSNPVRDTADFATGLVSNAQLNTLKSQLDSKPGPYLARIAVVHHHVLPVAYASGQQAWREPLMVLRNAGAVLRALADHRFDLVLHGHWHRAQVARFEFGVVDGQRYPFSVVAAGSAALSTNNPDGNCFNIIDVAGNGRISVTSAYYGGGRGPNLRSKDQTRTYVEPIGAVKRRAHMRARERHGMHCLLREQAFLITENGDLLANNRVTGMQLPEHSEPHRRRPLYVHVPPHARLVAGSVTLDPDCREAGVRLTHDSSRLDRGGMQVRRYWIELPPVNGDMPPYGSGYVCANSMMMTHWEAEQRIRSLGGPDRAPDGWDTEWVGLDVLYPMEQMVLSVSVPESLAGVHPYVRCLRHPDYPHYAVDETGNAEMPPMEDEKLVPDNDVQVADRAGLTYDATARTWKLSVEHPMVGYHYQLRWKLPGDQPDPNIRGYTDASRILLLRLGERMANGALTAADREAVRIFDTLRGELKRQLKTAVGEEDWVAALFVYDATRLALRPALSYRSWAEDRPLSPDFQIDLGAGIAGAAFQQRRILPWGTWARRSYIEPVPHPVYEGEPRVDLINLLAVPVYHSDVQDLKRPPPWGTIGVVSFGSSSEASRIAALNQQTGQSNELRRALRGLAQTHVLAIVECLS